MLEYKDLISELEDELLIKKRPIRNNGLYSDRTV